jgi:hypothetical protein
MTTKRRKATDSLANMRRQFEKGSPVSRAEEMDRVAMEGDAGQTGEMKPETPAKPQRRTTKSEKLVRVSVDLPRSRHKFLRDFAYDTETDGMSVMRGLLDLLHEDEELAKRLRERLATTGHR